MNIETLTKTVLLVQKFLPRPRSAQKDTASWQGPMVQQEEKKPKENNGSKMEVSRGEKQEACKEKGNETKY